MQGARGVPGGRVAKCPGAGRKGPIEPIGFIEITSLYFYGLLELIFLYYFCLTPIRALREESQPRSSFVCSFDSVLCNFFFMGLGSGAPMCLFPGGVKGDREIYEIVNNRQSFFGALGYINY